jgi:hypothetical protein
MTLPIAIVLSVLIISSCSFLGYVAYINNTTMIKLKMMEKENETSKS